MYIYIICVYIYTQYIHIICIYICIMYIYNVHVTSHISARFRLILLTCPLFRRPSPATWTAAWGLRGRRFSPPPRSWSRSPRWPRWSALISVKMLGEEISAVVLIELFNLRCTRCTHNCCGTHHPEILMAIKQGANLEVELIVFPCNGCSETHQRRQSYGIQHCWSLKSPVFVYVWFDRSTSICYLWVIRSY
jgi:hypothetical protein